MLIAKRKDNEWLMPHDNSSSTKPATHVFSKTGIKWRFARQETLTLDLGNEKYAYEALHDILEGMPELILSRRTLYKIKLDSKQQYICPLRKDDLALHELFFLQYDQIIEVFPAYANCHQLQLLQEAVQTFKLTDQDRHLPQGEALKAYVERMERVVRWVRKTAQEIGLASRLASSLRLQHANYKSIFVYIQALFQQRARLLVVRLDLFYNNLEREAMKQAPDAYDYSVVDTDRLGWPDITKPLMDQHKDELGRFVEQKFHCCGHVFVWEKALVRGFHLHTLLFFDGSEHCKWKGIAHMIGQHWNDHITKGRGSYYVPEEREYVYRAVGLIHYEDTVAIRGLQEIARYFAKPDWCMLHECPHFGRALFRGNMPDLSPATKLGRPRMRELEVQQTAHR